MSFHRLGFKRRGSTGNSAGYVMDCGWVDAGHHCGLAVGVEPEAEGVNARRLVIFKVVLVVSLRSFGDK